VESFLASLFFVDSQTGWAVGANGTIVHTKDGGQTWKQQPSGTIQFLINVRFLTPRLGWVVGTNGIILHTEEGGDLPAATPSTP
jgi:hypothetical protein